MNIERVIKFTSVAASRVAAVGCLLLAAAAAPGAIAASAAGDSWAYRVINGYNNEVRGNIRYRIDKVEADRVVVAFTNDAVLLGQPRTELYTPDGNWLRHPLINHDRAVEYEFAQPYPAYMFPLDTGKSWSMRVNAYNPANGKRASVRVDAEVLGTERITVPAGTFDTIKVRRRIYAGDWEGARAETNITEIEWYAPTPGRAIRTDSNSNYMDQDRCSDEMSACMPVRGDWHIFELVEASAAR